MTRPAATSRPGSSPRTGLQPPASQGGALGAPARVSPAITIDFESRPDGAAPERGVPAAPIECITIDDASLPEEGDCVDALESTCERGWPGAAPAGTRRRPQQQSRLPSHPRIMEENPGDRGGAPLTHEESALVGILEGALTNELRK